MPECVPRILDPQPHPNPALKPALPVNELGVTLLALLVQRCGGGSAAAAAAAAADAGEAGRGPDQDGGPVQGASPETDDHGPHARHRSALPRPHPPTHPPPTASCTVRGSQRPWAQAPSRWCVAPSASCAGWRTARTSRSARSPPAPRPHPTRALSRECAGQEGDPYAERSRRILQLHQPKNGGAARPQSRQAASDNRERGAAFTESAQAGSSPGLEPVAEESAAPSLAAVSRVRRRRGGKGGGDTPPQADE